MNYIKKKNEYKKTLIMRELIFMSQNKQYKIGVT
jgi:hypothetical protein